MRPIFILSFSIISNLILAQSVDRQVFNNCGVVSINSSYEFVTSFGETVAGEDLNSAYSGFLTPDSIPLAIGVDEIMNEYQFDFYPNPANSEINLISMKQISKVELIDALGNVTFLEENEINKHKIFITEQASGVYFLRCSFKESGNYRVRKIIITH